MLHMKRQICFILSILLFLFTFGNCATVVYDWNITWVNANPDGLAERPVIGINNQWPIPIVNVTKGDRLIFNVENGLGNQTTSLHWHGIYQNGTTDMDGATGVSQCNIMPGSKFVYNFTVDQPGTYWYHSHVRGQYPDGLRGPFIVNDPDGPYQNKYDREYYMTLSDWYHDQMPGLLKRFVSVFNPSGAEPVPDSGLINDKLDTTFSVEPGKTYFFRIVNMAAFAAQYLWIEGHNMTIVEVDGIWTQPQEVSMIYVTPAQRYSILVTAKNDTGANFPITTSMDEDLFDTVPDGLNPNVTAWLVYDSTKPMSIAAHLNEFNPYDDFGLVPYDKQEVWNEPSRSYAMTMEFNNLGDGANYAFVNGSTWVAPKVPVLYSVLTTGENATDARVYGPNTNSFILEYGQVVEIILNNADAGKHPFHLHGHDFQVLARGEENAGYNFTSDDALTGVNVPSIPMRRDTFWVKPQSYFVIRFRSFNPGVWLWHCHLEWHVASGLIATFIEAPLELQKNLTVPQNHFDTCRAGKVLTSGNAAGNTVDVFDLKGVPTSPAPLPNGFTARGIVALVFSCISAFLGMAVIAWYGSKEIGTSKLVAGNKKHGEDIIAKESSDSLLVDQIR